MRGQVSNPCRARRLGAPSYRLGGLFRRRKGAGDSVERLSLVFRCRFVVAKSACLRFRLTAKTALAPLLLLSNANPLRWALRWGPPSAAYIIRVQGLGISLLAAPLLRRAQVRLRETADTGNRCVFLVGPDALIGPFPGGPVCRPYKGDRNLIPYPARATARVAPTAFFSHAQSSAFRGPRPAKREPLHCGRPQKLSLLFAGAGHWPPR